MESKKCGKCQEIKPTSEFYRNKTRKDGLGNRCKFCEPKRHRKYYQENKEARSKQKKEYYQKNRKRKIQKSKEYQERIKRENNLDIGYRGLHNYIERNKKKPKYCLICNEVKRLEFASIEHSYTKNLGDWIPLCSICHKIYDKCWRLMRQ